jgi:hypothetical protein
VVRRLPVDMPCTARPCSSSLVPWDWAKGRVRIRCDLGAVAEPISTSRTTTGSRRLVPWS